MTGTLKPTSSFTHLNLYRVTFKFLGSMRTYGFDWNLNHLKVLDVTKYSVFIAFFKLKTQNKNSIIKNEPIYLHIKSHNNQSLSTNLFYVYFQLFR
jgi:hypothetical protein